MKSKKKLLSALVVFSMLAGCMGPAGYPQPITAKPAKTTLNKGMDPARIESQQTLVVRSFVAVEGEKNKSQEVVGARCTLSAPEFKMTVVTPQQVSMPIIKGKPGALTTTCKLGDKSYQNRTEAGVQWKSTTVSGSGSGGAFVAGIILSAAISAASHANAKKKDLWTYQPRDATELRVTLK